jgi:prevent-host-death family protein
MPALFFSRPYSSAAAGEQAQPYQFIDKYDWSDKLVTMKLPAAEFKAKCLALLDLVHERGEAITITKRGRVLARLVPADDEDERPWQKLRGAARWKGDPFAPVLDEAEVDAIK